MSFPFPLFLVLFCLIFSHKCVRMVSNFLIHLSWPKFAYLISAPPALHFVRFEASLTHFSYTSHPLCNSFDVNQTHILLSVVYGFWSHITIQFSFFYSFFSKHYLFNALNCPSFTETSNQLTSLVLMNQFQFNRLVKYFLFTIFYFFPFNLPYLIRSQCFVITYHRKCHQFL